MKETDNAYYWPAALCCSALSQRAYAQERR